MNFKNMPLFKNTKKKIGAGAANKSVKAKAKQLKDKKKEVKNKVKVIWEPFKAIAGKFSSQEIFLFMKHIQEVLYTGSRYIGKTDALIADFIQDVSKGYGADWRGVILRPQYGALSDAIKKAKKIILNAFPQGSDNPAVFKESKSDYKFVWKSGEELMFRAVFTEADYENKMHGACPLPW